MSQEREILQAIIKMCNAGQQVSFSGDWGGNTLTITKGDGRHTHCGVPDGTYKDLVDSLHGVLAKGQGLSWERGENLNV